MSNAEGNMDNKNDNSTSNIDWSEVVKKKAIGMDGIDLGHVEEVGDTYIIIQKGLINKKRYHIPKSAAEVFYEGTLKLRVYESDLETYEEKEGQKFEEYSHFKSSDMSSEMETAIPVMAESLEVTKRTIEDKVDIIKEPVKEKKSAEIDLTYEKITIEVRPFGGKLSSTDESSSTPPIEAIGGSNTTISIPIKREAVEVTKRSYVKEEIIIRKNSVKETKTITEEIVHEEAKYGNDERPVHER
ncbi:MAG: YsnF/AvaK domain-containing protein [Thermoproteota archaeon]|nr:YsnF/AvaK domain-containing protein [Thermoproteota archaeon]